MRLIYFLPLLSTKGGQERTLTDKANWLVNQGHEVLFVTFENDGQIAYPTEKSVRHVDLGCPYFKIYQLPFVQRLSAAISLKKVFRSKMRGVIESFRPDVIVVAVPLTEFFVRDVFKVAGRTPIIVESHLARGYEAIKRGLTEKIIDIFYPPAYAIRKSAMLIALTEGDARNWRRIHKNVVVIPNPVTFCPDTLSLVESSKCRIICVGRLSPQKRFDRLVDAFSLIAAKYPQWHIDIYGRGQEDSEQSFLQYVSTKGLKSRVCLHTTTDDIYTEYQNSDFYVLSSDFEGFGLGIVEAMACGIPVIATDCPFGPSEIIEDGKTGLLAKMSVKDLAEKMEWMITHDEERKNMGIQAYEAAARYRKELIIPEWEKAYLSVIV